MRAHRAILRPKFDQVEEILAKRLGELDLATWTDPEGGYFISLDVPDGTASPGRRPGQGRGHRHDRRGRRVPVRPRPPRPEHPHRPSMPTPDDVAAAIEGLATCVLLAAAEQRLSATA